MALQEHAVEHAAEGVAEKFNAGRTIIEHVSNSSREHPLFHLPTIAGIDFSVTKHVLMLWIVAAVLFVLVTAAVRRYTRQDRLVPSGFMNMLEAAVEFVRDSIVLRVLGARPVPFVASFAGYFIALHLIEALYLKRLFAGAPGGPRS